MLLYWQQNIRLRYLVPLDITIGSGTRSSTKTKAKVFRRTPQAIVVVTVDKFKKETTKLLISLQYYRKQLKILYILSYNEIFILLNYFLYFYNITTNMLTL